MSLIAGRGCRWPPRRDSRVPVRTVVGGGRDTHDGHENSPILVFFSNLLGHHRHPSIPWIHLPRFVDPDKPTPSFRKIYMQMWMGPRPMPSLPRATLAGPAGPSEH